MGLDSWWKKSVWESFQNGNSELQNFINTHYGAHWWSKNKREGKAPSLPTKVSLLFFRKGVLVKANLWKGNLHVHISALHLNEYTHREVIMVSGHSLDVEIKMRVRFEFHYMVLLCIYEETPQFSLFAYKENNIYSYSCVFSLVWITQRVRNFYLFHSSRFLVDSLFFLVCLLSVKPSL